MARTGNCWCLALYDWEEIVAAHDWLRITQQFFSFLNTEPNLAKAGEAGSDTEPVDVISFAEHLKHESPNRTKVCQMYRVLPEYKHLVFGWDVFAGMNISQGKTMIFCFGEDVAPGSVGTFKNLLRPMCEITGQVYGIGYSRSFELGPDLYAYGMASGLGYSERDMREADRIGAWLRNRMGPKRHQEGWLRDVYSLNILTSRQYRTVAETLSGQKLTEIARDRVYLWEVAETHLPAVRSALASKLITEVQP